MRETLAASISKRFSRKGPAVVAKNLTAVSRLRRALRGPLPDALGPVHELPPRVPEHAPDFVRRVTAALLEGRGESLPVSAFPSTAPGPWARRATTSAASRTELPVWDEALCIQCNKCSLVCPHAAIRTLTFEPDALERAPRGHGHRRLEGRLSAAATATSCRSRRTTAPAADSASRPAPRTTRSTLRTAPSRCKTLGRKEIERPKWDWAASPSEPTSPPPGAPRREERSQLLEPYFQFSTACAGCGETPYLKLMTQLFGDRMLVANATGCSSIFGANLPTTPWTADADGRGPAWANSLFEDNAEFGLGMRLALDARHALAENLLSRAAGRLPRRRRGRRGPGRAQGATTRPSPPSANA
jgi:pyruvate-ferredoxin/flavodoxin oxidoreductase